MLNLFNEDELKRLIREAVKEEVTAQLKEVLNKDVINTNSKMSSNECERIIKGVRGLAEYLGCGVNTAQNIIKSKILLENNIQYNAGDGWRFRKDNLNRLLKEQPQIFRKVAKKCAC